MVKCLTISLMIIIFKKDIDKLEIRLYNDCNVNDNHFQNKHKKYSIA